MCELKEWTASEIEEYDDARLELAEDGKIDCTRVYIKSEADKVIAELEEYHKMEVEQLLIEIVKLKEERRWRKFSDEKPKYKQWILLFVENPSNYGTYIELRRWDTVCKFDGENQKLYPKWMPLPSAPKEGA